MTDLKLMNNVEIEIAQPYKELEIRLATVEDVPAIVEFWEHMRLELGGLPAETKTRGVHGTNFEGFVPDWRERLTEFYIQSIKEGHLAFFLTCTRDEQELIASAGALIKDDYPSFLREVPYYGWIIAVYTEPEFRGQGIAKNLTQLCIDWFLARGIDNIRLRASRIGYSVYEKLGFESTSEMRLRLD